MPDTPEDLLKEYEQRLSAQKFEDVKPLIHEDAVFWFNDGSYLGLDAIEGAFTATFELIKEEKYWLTNIDWISKSDDAACCHYQFNWEGIIDGRASAGGGRGTSVLLRTSGSWQIVHEHLSRNP
ncbi:nuclear transport factor 2 family protein [Verrucomicrobiales bacterium BCK34]|nr:nuclear transport factor 2 family protein [Verrucomicrobiales bacterium BCK34]